MLNGCRLRKVGIESDVACGAHAVRLSRFGGERVNKEASVVGADSCARDNNLL
jgi:hypothetical protein